MDTTILSLNDWLDECLDTVGLETTVEMLDVEFVRRLRGLMLLERILVA